MRRLRPGATTFYCFSPLVMALTVVIEIGLLMWTIFKRKPSTVATIGAFILLFLAVFQVAEYGICERIGFGGTTWAKIGFTAITMLPVLGTHLVYALAKKKDKTAFRLAYLSGAVWIGLFLFGGIMEAQVCSGNYVIFELTEGFGGAYFAFYYFWLMFGSVTALKLAKKATKKRAQALRLLVVGYASFTIPATIIWLFFSEASRGLPSIMCGFAVTFALILGLMILPRVSRRG